MTRIRPSVSSFVRRDAHFAAARRLATLHRIHFTAQLHRARASDTPPPFLECDVASSSASVAGCSPSSYNSSLSRGRPPHPCLAPSSTLPRRRDVELHRKTTRLLRRDASSSSERPTTRCLRRSLLVVVVTLAMSRI